MICTLVHGRRIAENVYDFIVDAPEIAQEAKPGQFLHIVCGGDSYLRRPISICDITEGRFVRFLFEDRGVGTHNLSCRRVGEKLDILGPLGNGFSVPETIGENVLLIGGGLGVFPLLNLAKSLRGKATVLLGFRTKEAVVLDREFAAVSKDVFIATEDGSCGFSGRVTDIEQNILASNPVSMIYTCGPTPMMKQVVLLAKEKNVPVQVSLEERMACGIGACVGCVCKVAGQNKRVCKDGPVFDGAEVEF